MGIYVGGYEKITDYVAIKGPCSTGFHVPTIVEFKSIFSILTSAFGISGNNTTMGTYFKMPASGNLSSASGSKVNGGTYGLYRSCTPKANRKSGSVFTSSSSISLDSSYRASGGAIRPFKNESVIPDSSRVTLYDGSSVASGAGIFHNASSGLISISRDGVKWITIADKNLGASSVYNSGDTQTATNCGGFYQRGNNYMFPFSGASSKSTTRIDASSYGPGNYYSGSTFIYMNSEPEDWAEDENNNLWGWKSGVELAPVKNIYIGGYYEYSYDFRNKTISEFAADGWTYDSSKAPSFNSDGIYYTSMTSTTSGGIELNYNLTSAKKVTLNTSFVITNSTTHLGIWGIDSLSGTYLSGIMLTNMLGAHNQDIQINGSSVSTTSVSVSTGTYTETIEYDLTNKTYTYSGCYPASGTLTDEQISGIRNNNGITVAVGGSSGIKISTIDLVVEY